MRKRLHKKRRSRFIIRDWTMIYLSVGVICFVAVALVLLPLCLVTLFHVDAEESPVKDRKSQTITVYRQQEGRTITLDLEAYVAGVVAGEMPASFEMEALKAQAVAARTYGISKAKRAAETGNSANHPMAPLCDSTHCQVYRSEEELLSLKGKEWMEDGWLKVREAAEATAGELLYYQGNLVEQPLFHSSSGGKTENSEDVFVSAVSYLRSVESSFEGEAPHQNENISVSMETFKRKIGEKYGATAVNPNNIKILSRSDGGRVKEIQVGNEVVTGRDMRELFGLRSANFSLAFDGNNNIIFTTHGYGHGVGMSQWGANGMAKEGYMYQDILQHYYIGVTVGE